MFCTNCRKFEQEKIVAKADPYVATNLYPIERLPKYFNRVAVLPVYHLDPDSSLLKFVDQVFLQELIQEKIFEVIPFTINMNIIWDASCVDRPASQQLLDHHRIRYAANGVLFTEILNYSPYGTMSVSVK